MRNADTERITDMHADAASPLPRGGFYTLSDDQKEAGLPTLFS